MIPKNCRDFGQDHATKQVIRAKWRFDLMPFRARPILRKQIGRHQRGDAALCRVCARRRQGIKRRASFVNDRLLLPRTTGWPRLALHRPRLQKLGCQDQASGYLAPRLSINQVDQRLTLSGAGRPGRSEGIVVGLAGANAHRMFERSDENLAIADLAGAGRSRDRFDDARGGLGWYRDLDANFWKEIHGVFGAAIDFRVPLLAAVAFDLGHGQATDSEPRDGVTDVIELERLDDGDD